MSSRKRNTLKKSGLPDHRKLYSSDLPVCKSKNTVLQNYTNTKRTNSAGIHTKTKHGWGPVSSFGYISARGYGLSAKNKGLKVLFKKYS